MTKKTLFSLLVLLYSLTLHSKIVEIEKFEKSNSYVKPKTLILLDIDNTILEPVQMLGNEIWFTHQIKNRMKSGLSYEEAFDQTLPELAAIHNITHVRLIEPSIADIIKKWQNEGYTVMGFTGRGINFVVATERQLKEVGIDLQTTAPLTHSFCLLSDAAVPTFYTNGILFTGGKDKGTALIAFLKQLSSQPARILLIDDKKSYLDQVERATEENKIAFLGLWYRGAQKQAERFCPQAADLQRERFLHILSDEEAKLLLKEEDCERGDSNPQEVTLTTTSR